MTIIPHAPLPDAPDDCPSCGLPLALREVIPHAGPIEDSDEVVLACERIDASRPGWADVQGERVKVDRYEVIACGIRR
jgi:hypothetical protein